MARQGQEQCWGNVVPDRAGALAMAQLDGFEHQVLRIARHFFEGFARPESHAWMQAFLEAERSFPVPFGASIAHAISIAINELRVSRQRLFQFEHPGSMAAAVTLTDNERYFMLVLHHIRRGDRAAARAHALFLCEGNEVTGVLSALERLAMITGDVTEPHFCGQGLEHPVG